MDEIAKKERMISSELFEKYLFESKWYVQDFEWDNKLGRKQGSSKYNRK